MKNKRILAEWLNNNLQEFEKEEITKKLIFSFLVDFEESAWVKEKINTQEKEGEQ
jgi:hypothetical protein